MATYKGTDGGQVTVADGSAQDHAYSQSKHWERVGESSAKEKKKSSGPQNLLDEIEPAGSEGKAAEAPSKADEE